MRHISLSALLLAAGITLAPTAFAEDKSLSCGGEIVGNSLMVTKETALCEWPFAVEKMEVRCNGRATNAGDVFFASEKGLFALNGSAKANYDDPQDIWLDAEETWRGKVNLGPWITVGLALC